MTAARPDAQRQLEYVARRSLSRYGCFGCHDIPGYETAKPIGTPLANWGRKDVSQLAFENITTFLATHGVKETPAEAAKQDERFMHGQDMPAQTGPLHDEHAESAAEAPEALDPLDFDDDTGYFLQSLQLAPAARLPVAEAADAAELRLCDDQDEAVRRAAADAEVPVHDRAA